jgi:hypothetical protein
MGSGRWSITDVAWPYISFAQNALKTGHAYCRILTPRTISDLPSPISDL